MPPFSQKNIYTKPFLANSKVIFDVPLGGKIRRMNIVIQGNVTLSGGTANGTVSGEGAPANLVSRIYVNAIPANGSRYPGGQIVNCKTRSLLRYAVAQRQGKFVADLGGSTLGGGANGTYAVYMSIPIYFADGSLNGAQGVATALNTDPGTYSSVQVEVDTANVAACLTGNNATVDYSGLTVQYVEDRVQASGDTLVQYQEDHLMLIAATQERALDPAMPQDGSFTSMLILGEQSSALTLSDLLFQRLTITGPTIDFDKYAQDIRQSMIDDEWLDPSTTATGMYFADFTDGTLANSVAAGQLLTQFKVNNVSGANLDDLLIYTRRVFAPLPAKSSSGN